MKMQKTAFLSLLLAGLCVSSAAFAQPGMFDRNHPRRAEVLGRDRNLRQDLRQDRGQLNGNYGNLMAQDRRIHREERRDTRMNGGFITHGEQNRINHQENRLHREIRRDR